MKTKGTILLMVLFLGILLSYCKKDEIDLNTWVKGKWINEYSDTLCFSSSLMLNNGFPYSFKIVDDSLKIIPGWSNSLQEFSYKIEIDKSKDEIYIYDFSMHEKSGFKRLIICDCFK